MNFPDNSHRFGDFTSFEYLRFILKGVPEILFVIIYRPPGYCESFIDEFSELLSIILTDFNHLILTWDFNIHIDNITHGNAKEFSSVLDMFGLWQHVTEPTHLRGHTLDLVISKGVDISSVVVIDLALSDHFCILFDLLITQNVQTTSFSVKKRYINEKTSAQFREAIAMSPTVSAQSVDCWIIST